jgi:CBS domain-containing protein
MNLIDIPTEGLTARDVMTPEPVVIDRNRSIRDAIRLLSTRHISNAPVVDARGQCIGLIALADFARAALQHGADVLVNPPRPVTCGFQRRDVGPDGLERVDCVLGPGSCPFQHAQRGEVGELRQRCLAPHCVLSDWQVVETDETPAEVWRYMTPDPALVTADVTVPALARLMVDAHLHRVVVVDGERRPIGIISTMDLLAALGRTEEVSAAPVCAAQ